MVLVHSCWQRGPGSRKQRFKRGELRTVKNEYTTISGHDNPLWNDTRLTFCYPRSIRAVGYCHSLHPPSVQSVRPSVRLPPRGRCTAHNIQRSMFIFGTAIDLARSMIQNDCGVFMLFLGSRGTFLNTDRKAFCILGCYHSITRNFLWVLFLFGTALVGEWIHQIISMLNLYFLSSILH